ncbi:hypothetical protein [Micromonospora sp. NPDC050495]|uniref:hypothetical protein n=1 Tax=Micromonospora sp. NPDC050495 TaxID=3154936 RepID=UPI0033C6E823
MSFGTYARRVRDTARPYGERYSALRCAVSLYCPVGFTATWSWLSTAGDLRRDDVALVAALGRLERSREVWLAEMSAFARRRRAAKNEHRRTPTGEERRYLYRWRWPGPDGRAVILHAVDSAWTDHRTAPFPPIPPAQKGDLALLDATVAGHISTYLRNSGHLHPQSAHALLRCVTGLNEALRLLGYPSGYHRAFQYFRRLLKMSEMVVNDVLPLDVGAPRPISTIRDDG